MPIRMNLRKGDTVRVKPKLLEIGEPLNGSGLKDKMLKVLAINECGSYSTMELSCQECPGKVYLTDNLGRPIKESGCWGYTPGYALEIISSNQFVGTKIRKEI